MSLDPMGMKQAKKGRLAGQQGSPWKAPTCQAPRPEREGALCGAPFPFYRNDDLLMCSRCDWEWRHRND